MNIAKAAMVWRLGSIGTYVEAVCTMHVRASDEYGEFTEAHRAQVAIALDAWWNTGSPYGPAGNKLSALYPQSVRLQTVEVEAVLPTPSEKYIFASEGYQGTALDTSFEGIGVRIRAQPPQCSWMIGLRTTEDTRSGRGRLYLPAADYDFFTPISDRNHDDYALGVVDPGLRQELGYAAANLAWWVRNAGDAEFDMVLVVYSPTHGTAFAVTDFAVCKHLRTQRRRAVHPDEHVAYGLDGESA